MGDIIASLPATVSQAREEKSLQYFTGRPCKFGHIKPRTTSNKTCMECHRQAQNRRYEKYPSIIKRKCREYRLRNLEKCKSRAKEYQQRTRTERLAYYSARYIRKKDEIAEKVRAYRARRPGFANEVSKAYLTRKSRAMPWWVDRAEIRSIYAEAAQKTIETGVVYSVDHIYPLKGKTVCGLHVPWNLQIITKRDNCRKATKLPEDWVGSLP